MIKRICVFCGSSSGRNHKYAKAAADLGKLLAEHNIELIYGAGKLGLMGKLSASVMLNSGRVVGVYPKGVFSDDSINRNITKLMVTGSMHERKSLMSQMADAFIALPGGIGTVEELTEAITWSQLNIHSKPVGIVNTDGYYDHLLCFLKQSVKEGFLDDIYLKRLFVADTPRGVLKAVLRGKP